ncbi:MAG: hypothetical protein AB7Y46_10130 [Armatimonadota bacterium]
MIATVAVVTLATLTATGCWAQVTRDQLGREVKLMINVDKVMQPVAGWTTEEWMVRETAEAGFNVFSPRRGYDDLNAVRQVTEWCEKYGIYHLVWMRGTLDVPDPAAAQGRMLVWPNGAEQPLWSPNADEFWNWTAHYITQYALISAQNQHLIGVFLDYENYAPGPSMSGTVYDLSYDQMTLDMFAQAQGVEIPALPPAERKPWLVDNDLHDAFEAWQINHWRERARRLRTTIDAIDPNFQFCMYPAPGSRFMLEGVFPEWTTPRAPLIFADAVTYGRVTSFLPEQSALAEGRRLLEQRRASVAELGLPFIYTGGIDPVVQGADPEYCGKNAIMISEVTDGYWIFYEGPEYSTTHQDYFKWFAWANQAIAAGDFERQHAPRVTPDPSAFAAIGSGEAGVVGPPVTGETVEFPPVNLRARNLVLVNAEAGRPIEIGVRSNRVGSAETDLDWEVHDLTWATLATGSVPFGEPGTISFTPPEDGVYAFVVSAGSCSYTLLSANVPVGILAAQAGIMGGPARLYFSVPAGMERFTVSARSFGAETVRLNLYDPEGNLIATDQTTPTVEHVMLTAEPGDDAGKTWSVEITQADEGVLEDVRVSLGEGLPPTFSLVPEHVFTKQ